MSLAAVDCSEELYTPEKHELNTDREIDEAIKSGVDPRRTFIEASRTYRALNTCVSLNPRTALYGRLFVRLASALLKASKTKGTAAQQK